MRLVIAEKPSVARNIAEALGVEQIKKGYIEGEDYIVSWCVGHLVGLSSADKYDEKLKKWSYEQLPILPEKWKYEILESTKEQFKILKNLMQRDDITEIVNAADAGREGELIFRLVYEKVKCTKNVKRLWISSMEESAIKDGFKNLKDGSEYDNLYKSALCRLQADWLVGINATRLFSTTYNKKLIVGRVQTPSLAMLTKREKDIKEFKKETYYTVHIKNSNIEAVSERIATKEEAEQIQKRCDDGKATVISVIEEEKIINPPKLYDLTTLQRDANKIYGFTAQQTLDYAQSLYEKKMLTYPRTDSTYLTNDMEDSIQELLKNLYKNVVFLEDFEPILEVKKVLNSKKVSDHYAIIPTKEVETMNLDNIPKVERQLLNLVVNRIYCATHIKHIQRISKATLRCGENKFYSTETVIKQNGWKEVEARFNKYLKDSKTSDSREKNISHLEKDMIFENVKSSIKESFTSPPKSYTENTFLSAMERAGVEDIVEDVERKGLGTPATRASIIEKLIKSGYVERRNKQLLPTSDGEELIKMLPDIIKSAKLTAMWENELSLIAKGESNNNEFIKSIKDMLKDLVDYNKELYKKNKEKQNDTREVIGVCPKCGSKVFESKSNFYCSSTECRFYLAKNNRYFESMKKELTKDIAKELLKNGKCKVKGLYSKKKDKKFDATIHMDTKGEYPLFSLCFEK